MDRATLEALDDRHLWHPFTPHSVYRAEEPLLVVAGEGHQLIDVDGRRYLDGVGSLWCNIFGHRRPEIDRAIQDQLGRIAHATLLGHSSEPAIRLAARLAAVAPAGLSRVFFSDNGSTAVEVAVKMAYQCQVQSGQPARTRFLALTGGYSGDTLGAVSIGGIEIFHRRFEPLLFPVLRVPAPDLYHRPEGETEAAHVEACLAALDRVLAASGDQIAAVVIEPGMQGAGGMITYPTGYLAQLVERCRAAGALIIFDEVAMGMGRSGRLFAAEREGLSPDFICIAKGLTAGYLPLAATLTHERVFSAFLGPPEAARTFFHGHTFTGNALGAAAALATLDLFAQGGILEALAPKIAWLEERLRALRTLPGVGDVRQYGFAVGIELVQDRARRLSYPPAERRGVKVCLRARERGVFLRPLGDVIVLMPPLTLSEAELEQLVSAVEHGIRQELADAH